MNIFTLQYCDRSLRFGSSAPLQRTAAIIDVGRERFGSFYMIRLVCS